MYKHFYKRMLDIACSVVVLALFWWLYLLLGLAVRVKLGFPVIYKQKRPGKGEKIFTMLKFRSMTDERDDKGNLLPDAMRLPKFGRILRATSLDELPEIVNVLKGDMSLVGPRPLAVEYLPYYTNNERHRHDVRPGLTGLAQVRGRNALNWEEKFKYDLEYVNTLSFKTDVKIVFLTIKKVFTHEGIGQAEEAPVSLHIIRKNWLDDEGKIKTEYQN